MVELAKGADLYVTETTSPDDVVELFKKNGAWQAKTKAEQDAFLRHMHEEHVTPDGHRPDGRQGRRKGRGDESSWSVD